MSSNQQRRDAAKRRLQRQNERRAERAKAQRTRWTIVGVIAAVVVIAGAIWYFAGGDGQPADSADADTCAYPVDREASKPVSPPSDLNPPTTGTTEATIEFNSGAVTVDLDRSATPCTVNSFVSLAEQRYFDDTECHRLTASPSLKVLQCGDPTGTGTGGPGYSFADELSGTETYGAGTLAMANAGANTNGSQFFVVYADSQLPPDYAVFGTVTGGLDVVTAIADKGAAGGGMDGAPIEPVTIESVTVAS